jgi:peptidoglycan/LPS O-acetylase OafA/YrhL
MKFTNIQVLRFVAAGGVLLLHLGLFANSMLGLNGPAIDALTAPICWAGVPVFFAISGFVLTHSLQTTPVRRFLLLRAVRIYPPYWFAAAVVTLAGIGGTPSAGRLIRALLLIPAGPGRAHYVLGIEWSLVYEAFFYVVLALLAIGPRKLLPIGSAVWLMACLVRMAVAPATALNQLPTWGTIAFSAVNVPFLCGVFAYYLRHHFGMIRDWAPVVGPTLIVCSPLFGWDVSLLLKGLGSGLLVAWAAATPQLSADNLLVRYGDYSYGVFLIHVPIVRAVLGGLSGRPASLVVVASAGLIALSVGLVYGRLESALYRRLRGWLTPAQRRKPAAVDTLKRAA